MLAAALGVSVMAPPAEARTQLERLVKTELRAYGFSDVRVEDLTTAQLSAIYSTANRPGGDGQKRGMIKSILGGKNTVRGLFKR
jgi:hypothetical protein